MATFRDLLKAAKAEITEVDTAGAADRIADRRGRARRPRARRVRPGRAARRRAHPPRPSRGAGRGPARSTRPRPSSSTAPAACAARSRRKTLQELGYTDVVSMAGGFGQWKDEGRPWKTPVVLTADQRNRYQRHLLLPEVGVAGQAKLLGSKVLLLGAGGLGSPAALYLAAAGVGTIGIVDMDEVDASNLQRQILHNLDRIGDRKVDSAKKTLDAAQPRRRRRHLRHPPRRRRTSSTSSPGYDVIVDGADNFPQPLPAQRRQREARHPGRARLDLPVRGHGQRVPSAARARPTATWCPSRRPPSWRPSCAEAGVLGVLPGIVGIDPGARGDQGPARPRRAADRADPVDRHHRDEFRTFKLQPDPANEVTYENRDRIQIRELDGLCAPWLDDH